MQKLYSLIFVYLISYVTIVEPVVIEKQRPKRFLQALAAVISIITELTSTGLGIYMVIRDNMVKKSCGVKISPSQVNNYYNYNMEHAMELKEKVMSQNRESGRMIKTFPKGFQCDASYCSMLGANVRGTLGMCMQKYCNCKDGVATLHTCPDNYVFCPQKNKCAKPEHAILCH